MVDNDISHDPSAGMHAEFQSLLRSVTIKKGHLHPLLREHRNGC